MKKGSFGSGVMYVVLVLLLVGLAFLIVFNYRANMQQQKEMEEAQAAQSITPTPEPTATPAPTEEPERNTQSVVLSFAGDIVGQAGLSSEAQQTEGDIAVFDYTSELSGVQGAIAQSDLAACTLVGTLTSGDSYDAYQMNHSLAQGLASAGFDLVNVATDHLLDRGLPGLTETVETLNHAGLGTMGAYSTGSVRQLPTAEKNGIKIGFLSYTYSTSGTGAQPVSVAEDSWCIDLLTTDYMTTKEEIDYAKIDADIAALKKDGTDIVVCFVYWWDDTQYYTEPKENQTALAEYLFQHGVDILIGGGVKTPQPIVVSTVEREDGKANCVACYSLSNLMSCFNDQYTNLSAVVNIELRRDTDSNDVWVSAVSQQPLFMIDTDDYPDYADPAFRYRLVDAREAMAFYEQGQGELLSAGAYEAVRQGIADLNAILGEQYDISQGGAVLQFPY